MKLEIRIPDIELDINITAPEAEKVLEKAAMLLLKIAGWNISSWTPSERDTNTRAQPKPQNP